MARIFILLLYFIVTIVLPAIVSIVVLLLGGIVSLIKKPMEPDPQKKDEPLVFLSERKKKETFSQPPHRSKNEKHNKTLKSPKETKLPKQNPMNDACQGVALFETASKEDDAGIVEQADTKPVKEVVKPTLSSAKSMTIDEYRDNEQKKKIISGIIRDLACAAERNQAIDSLLKEASEAERPIGSTYDWRQDLMEYLVIQHALGNLKNRYSALQNATFVAGVLIREYMDSSKNKDFYDYILNRCGEMQFSSPLEKFAYGLNANIVTKLKSGEDADAIYSYAKTKSKEYDSLHRPRPEGLYPLPKTGDPQMDRFAKLAIELTHTRLRHLRIQQKDVTEVMTELSVDPTRREYHNFSDFFSHAFQFGYLTEKRFQRLYFLLYNIAQSISLGYSDAQIRHQINNLYVVESNKRPRKNDDQEEASKRSTSQRVILETIPYSEFNKKEHQIVSVSARVSREQCEHPLFKKTAKLAIDLINQYHRAETDSSEKVFFSVSSTLLKQQKPHYSQVYGIIASIANHIF